MGTVRYGARSEQQLRNREVEATSVDVWATTLVATYRTDPGVIAAVLPPPIEAAGRSVGQDHRGHGRHPGYPTFGAGSFSVRARHEGTEGFYALLMPMTTEQSVVGGRETFGEPKKLAAVELDPPGRSGHRHILPHGHRDRRGRGPVGPELELPDTDTRTDFYFKFLPSPTARVSTAIPLWSTATEPSRPGKSRR